MVGSLHDRVTALEATVDALGHRVEFLHREMQLGFRALEYQIGATEDRLYTRIDQAIRASEERLDHTISARINADIHAFEDRFDHTIAKRIDTAIRGSEERTLAAIHDGDADARRYMLVLHEEVIDRIRSIGENRP